MWRFVVILIFEILKFMRKLLFSSRDRIADNVDYVN